MVVVLTKGVTTATNHKNNMMETPNTILILHQENPQSIIDEVHYDGCHEERAHTGNNTIHRYYQN